MKKSTTLHENWSTTRKISFRYISIFFFLFIFPFPIYVIPWVNQITQPYYDLWSSLISWTGHNIFGMTGEISGSPTGSGDKRYDWLMYFLITVFAVVGGTVWSILDRKRRSYRKLWRWFFILLTYYLAYFMFFYGIIKIYYLQFGPPNLERLHQMIGQISPMRLMWTFIGFSESYTVFSGWSEAIGAVLILFRRTRTLGGLVCFGVMFNVFMMNMSYDIPVKLFSAQLALMGLYIALTDVRRLTHFFLLNKPTPSVYWPKFFTTPWKNWTLFGVQLLLMGYIVISQIERGISLQTVYGTDRPKPALYGVYTVETFTRNNDTLPPLMTDDYRWQRLLIDYTSYVTVLHMDDRMTRYNTETDTANKVITFTLRGDTTNTPYAIAYRQTEEGLHLSGVLESDTLAIRLKSYPLENFYLLNRGFHWVNEVPFNRHNPSPKE